MNKFLNCILIFSLLTLISCKPQSEGDVFKNPKYNVDPEIEPYVKTFATKMKLAGINKSTNHLTAIFSDDLIIGEAARCVIKKKSGGTTKTILVSRNIFDGMSDPNREEVIFHEMGHCVLGITEHRNATINGRPKSIMTVNHIGDILYLDYYGEYMAELFSNSSPEILALEFDDSTYF